MIIEIIKRIPFAVSACAFINILVVKIMEYIKFKDDGKLILKLTTFIFNPKTPFYFNYWLIYIVLAVVISIIFALLKKYSFLEMVIGIGVNMVLFVIMLTFIINRM